MWRTLLCSNMLILVLTSCPASQPTAPLPSVTGTWEGLESFPQQNGVPANRFNVRYVLQDTGGSLSGQVYACNEGTFECDPTDVSGNRNGSALTLRYNSALDDENNTIITVTTQGTFGGTVISGTTMYPIGNLTVTGTTSLSKK